MSPWNQRIPSRSTKKAKFCSFIQWSNPTICPWISIIKLEKHFDKCITNNYFSQDSQENNIFNYFLTDCKKESRNNDEYLAKTHIKAYFEYISLMAVKQRFFKFKDPSYLEETWQTYCDLATDLVDDLGLINKFYQRYQNKRKNFHVLEKHLIQEMASELKNRFYRLTGYGKYSPWYELKIIGKKPLKNKLSKLGIQNKTYIENCLKVRDYLYAIYSNSQPTTRWHPPTDRILQEAFEFAKAHDFNDSLEQFKYLIETCHKSLIPSPGFILSYKSEINIQSEIHYQDNKESPEEKEFISQQYSQELTDLESIMLVTFKNLEEEKQIILSLYYALGISDKKIEEILKVQYNFFIDRSTVCRWRNGGERIMLEVMGKWLQQRKNITSETLQSLEEYLKEYWLIKVGESKILSAINIIYQLNSSFFQTHTMNNQLYRNYIFKFLGQNLTKKIKSKINNFVDKIMSDQIKDFGSYS